MTPITRLISLIISAAIIIVAIPVLFGIGIIALGFVLVTSLVAAMTARFMVRRNPDIAKRWEGRYSQTHNHYRDQGPLKDKGPIIDHE